MGCVFDAKNDNFFILQTSIFIISTQEDHGLCLDSFLVGCGLETISRELAKEIVGNMLFPVSQQSLYFTVYVQYLENYCFINLGFVFQLFLIGG